MFFITIYLDLLFFLNWGMNWWLLWATGVVMRRPTKSLTLSLTAAFGSLCSFLWLLIPVTLAREILFKTLVAIAIVQLCFLPERLSSLIKLTTVFVLLSTIVAGITYALALSGTAKTGEALPRIGWYLVIGGPFVLTLPVRSLWIVISKYFRSSHDSTLFRFGVGGEIVEQEAILDTGNVLHEPLTYRPVVVVDFWTVRERLPPELSMSVKAWHEGNTEGLDALPHGLMERISLIPYNTVSGGGLMIGIRPEICELWASGTWHRVDAVIGFSPGEAKLAGKTALLPYTVWPVDSM